MCMYHIRIRQQLNSGVRFIINAPSGSFSFITGQCGTLLFVLLNMIAISLFVIIANYTSSSFGYKNTFCSRVGTSVGISENGLA